MSANAAGDPYMLGHIIPQSPQPPSIIGGQGIVVSQGGPWGTSISVDLTNNPQYKELESRFNAMEKQLCILKANTILQEKYPALQEAYDAYQLVLKLVNDQSS